MIINLSEQPPIEGGWTIPQALNEMESGHSLAQFADAKKEHAYRVELYRWEEAGRPTYCVPWEFYSKSAHLPVWTLEADFTPRKLSPGEFPPNQHLAALADAAVNRTFTRCVALLTNLRSSQLVAAGAKGHPTNPIVWLPQDTWKYYLPNVPTNEARWSTALGHGPAAANLLMKELWVATRDAPPASFFDVTYFSIRIFQAADVEVANAPPPDHASDDSQIHPPTNEHEDQGNSTRREHPSTKAKSARADIIRKAAEALRLKDGAKWVGMGNAQKHAAILTELRYSTSEKPPFGFDEQTVIRTLSEVGLK